MNVGAAIAALFFVRYVYVMIDVRVLEEATDSAFNDICELLTQLHTGSSSTYSPDRTRFEQMLSDKNIAVIVAQDGERIVGMAMLYSIVRVDEVSGIVDDVVVSDAYRGQGIATHVMARLIETARERGLKHLDLTSRPSREAANHLYQKVGFQKRETNPYRLKL